MYESYYGLQESPFSITPDPRFLFLTRSHRDALAYLHYGIEQRKGFLALTGEVGTGKTLLIRTLLGQLPEEIETAIVMNARLNFKQLLYLALLDFNVQPAGRSKVDLLLALQQFLLRMRDKQGNAVLIIDEAQNLSEESLEEFRLLSNFETANTKLIQIVLVGQPELRTLLGRHSLRQLRQRIPGVYDLSRLPGEAVREYIDFRLAVASQGRVTGLFDFGAVEEVGRQSAGLPRLINQICDRSLLVGYVKGAEKITADHVREAARELDWVAENAPTASFYRST
ncbi:MAG: AAA family ATPase [Candidatus Eisenbacteria bacterium]|nr:AAA family ATPase [Candidatus Eisenbacteria bacterium]MCC7143131.1 AAA family ATPase [Candidatus Eisenbacteria bacterium]